jgi:atlastin
MHPAHLKTANEQVKDEAIKKFNSVPKLGGASLSISYFDELLSEIDNLFINYQKHNENKNVFALSRTATSLIAIMITIYILSSFFEFFGLVYISKLLTIIFWSCFTLLSAWLLVKYSGEYTEIGEYIDKFTDDLWNTVCLFLFYYKYFYCIQVIFNLMLIKVL